MASTALLGARRTDVGVRAAALAALALLGVVGLSAQRRAVLDVTTTTVNCDGSVDIVTLSPGVPCMPGIVPLGCSSSELCCDAAFIIELPHPHALVPTTICTGTSFLLQH